MAKGGITKWMPYPETVLLQQLLGMIRDYVDSWTDLRFFYITSKGPNRYQEGFATFRLVPYFAALGHERSLCVVSFKYFCRLSRLRCFRILLGMWLGKDGCW